MSRKNGPPCGRQTKLGLQSDRLQGLVARREPHDPGHLSIPDRPDARDLPVDHESASPATAPVDANGHDALAGVDQFPELVLEVLEGLVPVSEPGAKFLVAVPNPEPRGDLGHRVVRRVPLDLGVVQREDSLGIAAGRGFVNSPHDLDVLLRHRQLSISRLGLLRHLVTNVTDREERISRCAVIAMAP